MASEFIVPTFATEAEEVKWWESHREKLSDESSVLAARVGYGLVL